MDQHQAPSEPENPIQPYPMHQRVIAVAILVLVVGLPFVFSSLFLKHRPIEADLGEAPGYEAVVRSRIFNMTGVELARVMLEQGLPKKLERDSRRDQSFEGLRDILKDSEDPEIDSYANEIEELAEVRRAWDPNQEATYTTSFIEMFTPLCRFLEDKTGLPAPVTMAQLIIESGWGGGNIVILKNNVLGIGNATAPDRFTVDVEIGEQTHPVTVHQLDDTTAFAFDSIGDCLFYYAYVLLQSPENANHYGALRAYIAEHRDRARTNRRRYQSDIIALLAQSYHHDTGWYIDIIEKQVRFLRNRHGLI